MSAVHIHLLSVHLPVVGVLFALGLLCLGHVLRRDILVRVGYGAILLSAAVAAVAYYSGPTAHEQLREVLVGEETWVEQHAVASRAFFVALVITAVLALQGQLQFAQQEPPPRWLRALILGFLALCCYLAVWSAHLGGAIRHEEIREPEWLLLPHLESVGAPAAESEPAG